MKTNQLSKEERKEIYEGKGNRLNVKNSQKFLTLLSGTDSDSYQKLYKLGAKQLQTATDIPHMDRPMIINFAIVKAINGYDPSSGANILTYFTSKIRGEVSDYRNKRNSMANKITKLAFSGEKEYATSFDKDSKEVSMEEVTSETPEDILISEDIYRRKIQAFRMAYSGIPLLSQNILTRIVDGRESLAEVASKEGLSVPEITKLRNYALSLILVRVLRSKHLDEEEKIEVIKEHNIATDY